MCRVSSRFVALGIACLMLLSPAALRARAESANPAYDRGVSLYNQKNYRGAAGEFEAAMKAAPNSPDAIYYCALCAQLSSNRTRARQLFEYLIQRFPTSRTAPMAQSALNQLSALSTPSSGSSGTGSTGGGTGRSAVPGGSDPELASVPDLVRVPFEKHGNDVTVWVQVNGKPEQFVLDTGAFSVCVGMNHLKEWGISTAQAKDTMDIGGVGEGKAKGWVQRVDLRLGQIFRKNFPVTVMDNMPTEPLLGQTFLRAFNVSIDEASRMVLLAKKGGTASRDIVHKSYTGIEVPFTRGPGGHMMVNVLVNGKPLIMMFDTGCEQTCFALTDWKRLGFDIPAGVQAGTSRGVLGETTSYHFNTDSIVLRGKSKSIEQTNAPVSVTVGANDSLLGMSFFGKYKYTIDSGHNVIIFEGASD